MTATTGRIDALDVLRGVAILGTLGTNVWLLAYPGGPVAWLAQAFSAGNPLDTALLTLTNGKFLALLTLLFGVGIELQYRAAVRRGNPWPGRYPVRAAILFVEGLVHYVLVFEFDVLMGYAIASFLVAYLVGRSDRAVRAWAGAVGAVYAAALSGVTALLLTTPDVPPAESAPDPALTASWPHQVLLRLEHAALFRAEIVLIVPSAVVLFLVGSRLVRAGAFTATPAGARIRRRLTAVGMGVGVPLNALAAAAGPDWFLVDRYLAPPLVALGLLGLGTTLVQRARREPGPVRRGLTAVGRTALSCYVLQNVLAAALCYGWGFGLAERFAGAGPWFVLALWAGVSAVLLAAAPLWLRHVERGPLELLVHRAYGRLSVAGAARTRACSSSPHRVGGMTYDAIVIGGGAAGLAGATVLLRSRRSVLMVDGREPRNAPADGLHNFLTREGTPPSELLAAGREEVIGYGGEVVDATAAEVELGFRVRLDDGRTVVARRLLVATGLVDELPDVPGLAERWGRDVLHCPYCHGWEVRGQAVGVLATGPMAVHQALLFRQLTEDVTLFRHTGPDVSGEEREQLAARDIAVVDGEVSGLEVVHDRLAGVRLASGRTVARDVLVVAPRFTARVPPVPGLVAEDVRIGDHVIGRAVPVGPGGATAVPGVWAAGNVADVQAQVISAAAAGVAAGAAINADLVAEDARPAVVAGVQAGRAGAPKVPSSPGR